MKRICRVLEIDRSSYCDHLARAETREAKALAEDELAREIAGITRRKRRSLTKADKKAPPAPDLIRRDFTAVMPGIRLVGDVMVYVEGVP